jgi:hypothetical protein
MWFRVGISGLALLGLLTVTGVAPGDSTRATVDHCYDNYHGERWRETKCTGHWTRLGYTFTGRVYGVDVGYWPVIPPAPRADGWNELAVPENTRDRPSVAVPGASLVAPWLVWAVRAALVIEVAALVVLLARLTRTRRRSRAL